jgi:hypothetical protein
MNEVKNRSSACKLDATDVVAIFYRNNKTKSCLLSKRQFALLGL